MRLFIQVLIPVTIVAWAGTAALAMEDGSGAAPGTWDQAWNADHIETGRVDAFASQQRFALQRTEFWSAGLSRAGAGIVPQAQKTVGAKLRPFADYDLVVGTEMSRALDSGDTLTSKVDWQLGWSRQWPDAESLEIGLSTSGTLDNASIGYSQSAGGSIGIRLLPDRLSWETQFILSPTVNLDTTTGIWTTNLRSEIVTRREITTAASPILSVVNIRMGYDVAPDTHPAASARVELQFSPRS